MASHWYSWPMAGVCALTFGMFNSKKCARRERKKKQEANKQNQNCSVSTVECE